MFTDSDRILLARPLFGLLTVSPAAGRLPAPRPVWFEATPDGDVQLFSLAGAPRLRRLEADPQASFVVIKPPGETEGWVSIEADVTVHPDGGKELADRLTERYWDATQTEQRAAARATWEVEDLRRIVLHPRRVTRGPA
ncbi:pyridoxamine 5'-phosphate oxidase family protein [Actinomadura alba]|uniref:Pyridoxamine 5'-phosphate oxidase family protein n=1 Tax=Actinomadura alba TaxID=406431 RepID=A0ABR7LZI3_9ACTN|nr:pyridoxamine 5'-phosphate oxidase family protein [Actinomadura alba]MBC6470088.1 pyridoxamine 5'-phosphate oxidase family protein [Actinomadura alba]